MTEKKEKYDSFYYILRNFRESIKWNYSLLLTHREWREILKLNKKFRNIHNGHRCFILGNGPSLKSVKLNELRDEYVFTVNQISKHPDYSELNSNYHFWADEGFFNLDLNKPEDLEVLDTMKNLDSGGIKPVCFYPIEHMQFVKENELDKQMEAYYFLSKYNMYGGYDKNIDYTGVTLGFGTVVQWCITMAIYMGFSEIYLLGCDTTSLINNIKATADKIDYDNYGYNVTSNEIKRYSTIMKNYSLITSVDSYLSSLKDYERLYKYCVRRGVKLINLTETTAIDSIPRNTLENILNGKQ